MTAETESPSGLSKLSVDPVLLDATIRGLQEGLLMCGLEPKAVGATCFFTPRNPMSVIVGLVGQSSGTVTLNLSKAGALHLVNALTCEESTEVDEETIDAIQEIGNMVAGRVKDILLESVYEIEHISLPSVIFGHGYQVLYSQGINTCSIEFELENMPFSLENDRFFTCTVSLLPGPGV